jgi:hypothetical protein
LVGRALAKLHRSHGVSRGAETDLDDDGLEAMAARAEEILQALPGDRDLVSRFRVAAQRIVSRTAVGRPRLLAPTHGALGWDCIHYGVDGRFYLYRFETYRLSDPGLDLGGFAADLLCFTLANQDEAAYRIYHDAFLSYYNSTAEHPIDEDDLAFYTALALSARLQRAQLRTRADAAQLLVALDAALRGTGQGWREQVSS